MLVRHKICSSKLVLKYSTSSKFPLPFSIKGAHGFITQHHWAKSIGAFVNLDACGAGGREIVFQAGPGNTWLIEVYKLV